MNHPVGLVSEVVDHLDLEHIIRKYKGGGTTSFHQSMLIKVLFYANLGNIYFYRKTYNPIQEHIHFIFPSGKNTRDFRTVNYFRGKRVKG